MPTVLARSAPAAALPTFSAALVLEAALARKHHVVQILRTAAVSKQGNQRQGCCSMCAVVYVT